MKFLSTTMLSLVAAENCGNGFSCPTGSCVSHQQGVGAKWGCTDEAVGPGATICADSRFACPEGYKCDDKKGTCVGAKTFPNFENVNANKTSTALTAGASTVCSIILGDLPSFCICKDSSKGALGGIITCNVNVLGIDTLIVTGDVEPCANPMYMSVAVADTAIGFTFGPERIVAGDTENIDIGLDIGIPGIAAAGVYLALAVTGNIDSVDLKLGINVCGEIPLIGQVCGNKIPGVGNNLPIWLLDQTFDFGTTCVASA